MHAGTTAELAPSAGKQLHKALRPLLKGSQSLWPTAVQSYAAFCKAAEWVQSRAFHINAQNWVTGSQTEGALSSLLIWTLLGSRQDPAQKSDLPIMGAKIAQPPQICLDVFHGRAAERCSRPQMSLGRRCDAVPHSAHRHGQPQQPP